jgi:hypothetical protein
MKQKGLFQWRNEGLSGFSMLRIAKRTAWLLALAAGFQSAHGFSLLGPANEPYQLGGRPNELSLNWGSDIGAPKNIGEEYRWNTPTLYYSYDQNFLDYFGSNGVYAVDQAIGILNSLPKVSAFSADLSEFPLEADRKNFKAETLFLIDLKSEALNALVEQMGLAEPDRYTWQLHNRFLPAGATCPAYVYSVIKRNFDPITWEPSSYVNGTLYTYSILELCPPPSINRADATEVRVDPTQPGFTAVASRGIDISFLDGAELDYGFLRFGSFYNGLTRDDVGGLRYLYRTNNMNVESVSPQSLIFETNFNAQLLVTSNLTLLQAQALTNTAAALAALYPGLVITSTTNTFVNVWVTNLTAFFTNEPWSPAGFFTLAFATNRTLTIQTVFHHTFANLVTFQFINGRWVAVPVNEISPLTNRSVMSIQTSVVTNAPWAPAGTLFVTNTFTRFFSTNIVSGEFFILPSNVCDIAILAPQITNLISFTNTIVVATNNLGQTNVGGQSFIQTSVDFFTNHVFVIFPVNCVTSPPAQFQGIEKITFVRHDFDSLIGQFFHPITNIYHLKQLTNSQLVDRTFTRIITQPDILFTAQDLVTPAPGGPFVIAYYARTEFSGTHIDAGNALAGLAGPGTIQPTPDGAPSVSVTFDKVGPIFINSGPNLIDEATGLLAFIWGSFDGTTNEPIVYPQGRSIVDLENQVLMRVTTGAITNAVVGVALSEQLQGSGGSPPFTWALAPGSPGLPPGLDLSAGGLITGIPQSAGTFDIVVRMTDIGARFVDRPVVITVSP